MKNIKNTISFKISIGLATIFILCGISLNLLIRLAFKNNFENFVSKNMSEAMSNYRLQIKQTLILDGIEFNKEALKRDSYNIVEVIKNNNANVSIYDTNNLLVNTLNGDNRKINFNNKNKATINVKYTDNTLVEGVYPIYIESKYLGVLVFKKDFTKDYLQHKNLINIITLIEISMFILVFILAYFYTRKIVSPLKDLKKMVNKLSMGDFNVENTITTNDEIYDLSKEFFIMKDKLEEQFNNLKEEQDKIKRLSKVKEEFFYNVTHELKTPLTAISGYSEILKSDDVKTEFRERANNRIYIESQKLNSLIVDIINISKNKTIIEEPSYINLREIIQEVIDTLDRAIINKNLKININLENEQNIFFHLSKIKSLIENLIVNAVKYSLDNESIDIVSCLNGESIKFEIKNKSLKIKKEVQNKLLEPFVKGGNSNDKAGNGLGLYICKEIVENYGGHINIDFLDVTNDICLYRFEFKIPLNCNKFVIID